MTPGHLSSTTRELSVPPTVQQRPHFLAIDGGIRIDRATLRTGLQRRNLRPHAANPPQSFRRRLRLLLDPMGDSPQITLRTRLQDDAIDHERALARNRSS